MQISIAGSYITKIGELWQQGLEDLLKEASFGAIKDAEVDEKDIEAVFVANMAGGDFNNQRHLNAIVSGFFDHFPPSIRVEGACASGGLALLTAQYAVLSGKYKTVLVAGAEKMTDLDAGETTQTLATAAHQINEYGSTFPALYALLANVHMQKFGTTRNQLSAVSIKNHQHAFDNPKAQFHKKFTIEQINNSFMVADPLRLLDCSPISDGAAAVVLTSKKVKAKAKILGAGHGQDTIDLASRKKLTELAATKKAAQQAYQEAGLKPQNINAAEVHDCFTIAEILATEDLGFFEKGTGGKAVEKGKSTYGGEIVINPSGGLKAGGHPIGATGVKQLAYLSKLIEQDKFKYGLIHNIGGSGATCVVHIIGKR